MRTLVASSAALAATLVVALPTAHARSAVLDDGGLATPPPSPTATPPDESDEPTPPSATASASPTRYQSDRDRYARWRLSAGAGFRIGSFRINGAGTGTAAPFHLDLGARKQRVFFYASYDLMNVDVDPPRMAGITPRGTTSADLGDGSGLVQRLGANARYAFGRVGEHDGGFDVWAEAGLGVQHITWDAGGVWNRPDLALGIGGTMLGLGRHDHGGFSIGLRVMLAPRTDVPASAPAVCGGPCDRATSPSGTDRSFLFDMTVTFGR